MNIKKMSALSVAQPWADCIIRYGKNIENRSRNLNKRGTVAIYASASKNLWRFDDLKEDYGIKLEWDDVEKGVILGFVDIVDVVTDKTVNRKTKKWFNKGCYGYVLENVFMLKDPVSVKPTKGAISFWTLQGSQLKRCLQQVPKSRLARFKPWE